MNADVLIVSVCAVACCFFISQWTPFYGMTINIEEKRKEHGKTEKN